MIEINEGSDHEIEDFLSREYPEIQSYGRDVIIHIEPYDLVTILRPCLKVKEGFSGIRQDLKKTTDKTEAPLVDCVPRRSTISPVHCDGCLDWVERYYTDVPLLQARIKTLTA